MIQSGEENNTVKENTVSRDRVEVIDMAQIVMHTYNTREGNLIKYDLFFDLFISIFVIFLLQLNSVVC